MSRMTAVYSNIKQSEHGIEKLQLFTSYQIGEVLEVCISADFCCYFSYSVNLFTFPVNIIIL